MRRIVVVLLVGVVAGPVSGQAAELVSLGSAGVAADANSDQPAVSADGRFVAFDSLATNLVANDNNGQSDVFILDRQTGVVELVSVASDGQQGNLLSIRPALSDDGRHVVFLSQASNLAAGDSGSRQKVLVRDRQAQTTSLLSVTLDGSNLDNSCLSPSISGDGRYVVFYCYASNLLPNAVSNTSEVVLVDRGTPGADGAFSATPVLSRVGESNGVKLSGPSFNGYISGDGNWLVFASTATDVNGVNGGYRNIFLKNRATGDLSLLVGNKGGDNDEPRLSYDASYVVFTSAAALVSSDSNVFKDIYLYNRTAATVSLISGGGGKVADGVSGNAHISSDGRYISFDSAARNLTTRLVAGYQVLPVTREIGGYYDAISAATGGGGGNYVETIAYVYVADRLSNTIRLASSGTDGSLVNGTSFGSTLSADASLVAFVSAATNILCSGGTVIKDIYAVAGSSADSVTCGSNSVAAGGKGGGGLWWPLWLLIPPLLLRLWRGRRVAGGTR